MPQYRPFNYAGSLAAMKKVGSDPFDPENVYNLGTGTYGKAGSFGPDSYPALEGPTGPILFSGSNKVSPDYVDLTGQGGTPDHPTGGGPAVDWASMPNGTMQNPDGSFVYPGGAGAFAPSNLGLGPTTGGRRGLHAQVPTTTPVQSPSQGMLAPNSPAGATDQINEPTHGGWTNATQLAMNAKARSALTASDTGGPAGPLAGTTTTAPTTTTPGGPLGLLPPPDNSGPGGYYNEGANLAPNSGHQGQGPYGNVPDMPNPIDTARRAAQGNLGNLKDILDLGTPINAYNTQELLKQYEAGLPGYGGLIANSSKNIADRLAGKVPADVLASLQSGAAERGVASGSVGDDNSNYAYLKALGLTSLGLQQEGEQDLTNAIRRTPTAQLFNPQSMFVSPGDMQGAQWMANQLGAAPDPRMAADEAERRALEGIEAGKRAAGGGGTTISPGGGGGGGTNPITGGQNFNSASGGGSLPTKLGGNTNLAQTDDLQNWYDTMFGEGSYEGDLNAPDDSQVQNWWDNMYGEGSYDTDLYGDTTGQNDWSNLNNDWYNQWLDVGGEG